MSTESLFFVGVLNVGFGYLSMEEPPPAAGDLGAMEPLGVAVAAPTAAPLLTEP